MNELIKVDFDKRMISARELWEALDRPWEQFNKWFNKYKEYGFIENQDYKALSIKILTAQGNAVDATDYEITIDMAKELAMLQKSEKGKQIRQYLIELEKAWNNPEAIMARALKIANQTIEMLKPKAEYFDALVERNLLTNFRDTAKELGIKERQFIQWLLDNKYIFRDKKGKLKPYAQYTNDLFEEKDWANDKTAGVQTLITPKGKETFRLLLQKEVS